MKQFLKNAVVIRNYSLSLRPSFSDEGTISVRARGKPWKKLIDVHETSGLNREKKKPSRARVSGNRCNTDITFRIAFLIFSCDLTSLMTYLVCFLFNRYTVINLQLMEASSHRQSLSVQCNPPPASLSSRHD